VGRGQKKKTAKIEEKIGGEAVDGKEGISVTCCEEIARI